MTHPSCTQPWVLGAPLYLYPCRCCSNNGAGCVPFPSAVGHHVRDTTHASYLPISSCMHLKPSLLRVCSCLQSIAGFCDPDAAHPGRQLAADNTADNTGVQCIELVAEHVAAVAGHAIYNDARGYSTPRPAPRPGHASHAKHAWHVSVPSNGVPSYAHGYALWFHDSWSRRNGHASGHVSHHVRRLFATSVTVPDAHNEP